MKTRILLSAAMLFLAAVPLTAQIRIVGVSSRQSTGGGESGRVTIGDLAEQKTIGEASLECTYAFHYFEETPFEENDEKNDVMILQTGNGISKFYSYLQFRSDSLLRHAASPEEIFQKIQNYKRGASWMLFKNYPEGKFTLTDNVFRDFYLYEEDAPVLEWTIGEETKEIEGYTCQKAECDFRGRHWTAWFSPEIPVSEGPWKLGGLPGLIMQAVDGDELFTFTLTGLRQVESRPVTMDERQFFKINRENYLKTKRKFAEDPTGVMSQNGVHVLVHRRDGAPADPEATAPKELKYDFLETDYR